jgi:hypothetical protein
MRTKSQARRRFARKIADPDVAPTGHFMRVFCKPTLVWRQLDTAKVSRRTSRSCRLPGSIEPR